MSTLFVRINRAAGTATFSGPGTFSAKDEIKTLGRARWLGAQKSWEVSSFALTNDELSARFPAVIIEEVEDGLNGDSVPERGETGATARTVPKVIPRATGRATETDPPARDRSVAEGIPKSFSVGELLSKTSSVLNQAFPGTTFVRGVISSVKTLTKGPVFLDLAEDERPEESVRCVIWRDVERVCKKLFEAGFALEKDLQVMFETRVGLSRRGGYLSLEIVGVVAEYTVGKLAALREITNDRLRKEGLFGRNKSAPFPFLPQRLGLLTSPGGTVINDFMASLGVAGFGFSLSWFHVRVQGSEAKADLLAGIRALVRENVDAILIFRGGGSAADLAIFNDYDVAREVCLCPLPIVSAIGHQEDQSSVQDVSWQAFGVPKDLGRFFADIVVDRKRSVFEFSRSIFEQGASNVERLSERLQWLAGSIRLFPEHIVERQVGACVRLINEFPLRGLHLVGRAVERANSIGNRVRSMVEQSLALSEQRLALGSRLPTPAESTVQRAERDLKYLEQLVQGASPEVQLGRGFALAKRVTDGKLLTSAAQLTSGEVLELQFSDASAKVQVE